MTVPSIGFGTWQLKGDDCYKAVSAALEAGYRHIDTADIYGNHLEVEKALTESEIPRSELFITTKIWRDYLSPAGVAESAERFLTELNTDYIDLLLIHWPNEDVSIEDTLTEMNELLLEETVRSIGVSNFTIPLLEKALKVGVPIENLQIELHPSLNQKELKAYCDEKGIIITAYSPIAQGKDLSLPVIQELAQKYGKTPSQIILNWIVGQGVIAIPRTTKTDRLKENLDIYSFELSPEERAQIDNLDLHERLVHPDFAPFKR